MPRCGANMRHQRFFRESPYRRAVREERRLGVLRCRKLLGRPLEAETTQIGAKGGIDLSEDSPRDGKNVREVLSHAGLLGALPGKQQDDVHR
jgi:hypothetical protein